MLDNNKKRTIQASRGELTKQKIVINPNVRNKTFVKATTFIFLCLENTMQVSSPEKLLPGQQKHSLDFSD